jgi:enoyl-CoA hydratase/carnithine racemase
MTGNILVETMDGVLRLTFNRPAKKNALNRDMYRALIAALETAGRDEAIKALIFAGAGGDFTAGNDLVDFRGCLDNIETFPALAFVRALAAFEKPMVAAVQGDAIGVGATLLFHCDLVYAAPDARLRMPFIDLGLVPEAGVSLLAPHRLGMARAAQYLLLGDAFSGEDALRFGLANGLAPAAQVMDVALEAASRLAAKPAQALRDSRRLLRGDPALLRAQIDAEARLFARALASPETQARLAAFFSRS